MTSSQEMWSVVTVWLQCGLLFVVGFVARRMAWEYWEQLKEEQRKLQAPETKYKANSLWKPR